MSREDREAIARRISRDPGEDLERMAKAVEIGLEYGFIDGAHHKQWVIDQMLRALMGFEYAFLIEHMTDEWDEGIAP